MSDKNLITGLAKKWGKFFTTETDGHFSEDGELLEYWAFNM